MIKKLKAIISLSIVVLVMNMVWPAPGHAFLAASGIPLLATTLLPQVMLFLLNVLLTIIAFIKKKKFLSLGLLLILLFGGFFLIKKYLFLKKINANPVAIVNNNSAQELTQWEVFKNSVTENQGNDVWVNFLDAGDNHLDKDQTLKVSTYEPNQYSHVIGYTLADFLLEGTTMDLAGDFFIEIFNLAFDSIELEKFLTQKGIAKSDKILVYCPSGSTSRVVAFILKHYGYQAYYLPLKDAENITVNDQESALFFIQNIKKSELTNHNYIYLMLMINDYYVWSENFCENNSFQKNIYFYRIKNELVDADSLRCPKERSKLVPISDLKIPLINRIEILNLTNTRILCHDKWHCFLTKHILFDQKLHQVFSKLYCLDCGNQQVEN